MYYLYWYVQWNEDIAPQTDEPLRLSLLQYAIFLFLVLSIFFSISILILLLFDLKFSNLSSSNTSLICFLFYFFEAVGRPDKDVVRAYGLEILVD